MRNKMKNNSETKEEMTEEQARALLNWAKKILKEKDEDELPIEYMLRAIRV
jgi:hypothetical protein